MHLLILLFVRIIRLNGAVRALIRWGLPSFVIRNWKTLGPANRQMVMEHEMFRHIETEIFVHHSRLSEAMDYVKDIIEFLGTRSGSINNSLRNQLAKNDLLEELLKLQATYCHHFPICVRKVLADDTLIRSTIAPVAFHRMTISPAAFLTSSSKLISSVAFLEALSEPGAGFRELTTGP